MLRSLVRTLLRLWLLLVEHFRPGEAFTTHLWAAVAGVLGGLSGPAFRWVVDAVLWAFSGSRLPIEETATMLPEWHRLAVPAVGGLLAGLALHFGARYVGNTRPSESMEAITIGTGVIRTRPTLLRILSSVFSIASGGSIGREGAMVQLNSMLASAVGRRASLSPARLRLMVACGAAGGIASAYNAPIGGAVFVAEVVLGSIAMTSFGPLIVAAVVATIVSRALMGGAPLFRLPAFELVRPLELLCYLGLGLAMGVAAPLFLELLERSSRTFAAWKVPVWARLFAGGLVVGIISTQAPYVWGNGSGALSVLLNTEWAWTALLALLLYKIAATASTVGSGAVGGVFTPTLLVGAALGALLGGFVHAAFPYSTAPPQAYAVVGMGAFLAATTHAPLTAILILFDMTLNHEVILPLMVACVSAYSLSFAIRKDSLYTFRRGPTEEEGEEQRLERLRVRDLMKADPVRVKETARFPEIVQAFVKNRHHNLFVVGEGEVYRGVIPLHEIKPHLNDPELAKLAIAQDLLHDDLPVVTPGMTLGRTLQVFTRHTGERLPVVEDLRERKLVGSVSKTDLILTMRHGRAEEEG